MSDRNQNNSFEKCREELLNYKLDEILGFYAEDFGDDVADEIENKIILEIGEDNPQYYYLFEQKITHLWYELVYKVTTRLEKGLPKLPNTIDFSDVIIEINNIRKKAKDNRIDNETLKEIYFDDINKIKIRVKSKLEVEKNIKKQKNQEKHKDRRTEIVLSIIMLVAGYILTKLT